MHRGNYLICHKGQIKPKADWRAIDSPKKRMNEFGFFAMKSKEATKNKIHPFVFWAFMGTINLVAVVVSSYFSLALDSNQGLA